MAIDQDDVEKIALLARLGITADEKTQYAESLTRIIDWVDQLADIDTDNVTPMAHPLDTTQRLRADEVTEANQRDAFQANAPACEDGLYLVPKAIN